MSSYCTIGEIVPGAIAIVFTYVNLASGNRPLSLSTGCLSLPLKLCTAPLIWSPHMLLPDFAITGPAPNSAIYLAP
ncbi:hypothetical protein NL676_012681 [Syzygium grande]|nr:hypothetical protein NL676_012681 [Syzygium grande]